MSEIQENKAFDLDTASDERSAVINIGGDEYKLILTTKATKEIAKRYGGLENLGTKLMNTKDFEMALDEVVWLITLLLTNPYIHNLRNKEDKKELLKEDDVELLTSPLSWLIIECNNGQHDEGNKRHIESESSKNVEVG